MARLAILTKVHANGGLSVSATTEEDIMKAEIRQTQSNGKMNWTKGWTTDALV